MDLLPLSYACAQMRVSYIKAWRWCVAGMVPARRFGNRWFIYPQDLERQAAREARRRRPEPLSAA